MKCPNCSVEMTGMTLEGRMDKTIAFDMCSTCQAFWFDKYESLALANASAQYLVTLIQQASPSAKAATSETLHCPRCFETLVWTHDIQNDEKFRYWRCPR